MPQFIRGLAKFFIPSKLMAFPLLPCVKFRPNGSENLPNINYYFAKDDIHIREDIMPIKEINNRIFDARPDRIDYRDRLYNPSLVSLPEQYPDPGLIKQFLMDYA